MILPLDIFTLIIEELVASNPHRRTVEDFEVNGDTQKALKATCLTCRALVPFCQREIFAAIRFDSGPAVKGKWRMVANLDRLLQQSPHLSDYIRNVYFADDSRDHPKSQIISRVLLKLHNVRVFDLDKGRYSSGGNWGQFPNRVAFAIGNIIKLPSLRVLRMSFIQSIPPEILQCTPQLQHLILSQCSWSKSAVDNAAPAVESSTSGTARQTNIIQTIESADPSVVQPFVGPKTLEIEIASDEDVNFVLKIVQITGELRDLQWFVQPNWTLAGLSKVLSTRISRTLTTLTVSFEIYRSTKCGLDVEFWRLPKQNVLQSLVFTIYSRKIAFLDLEQFREIDRAITPDRFPCLTEIRFQFIVLHLQTDISEWLEGCRANFPLLSSSKDVDFRCSLEPFISPC